MNSLDSVLYNLKIGKEELALISPGSFVKYKDEKDVSSIIGLASSNGIIQKTKKRSSKKTLYEFLALKVWNELLDIYSNCNNLNFRAPKPLGIGEIENKKDQSLFMTFINGYKLKSLSTLKRSTPVKIKDQEEPLPLFSACAYHLGALNKIKEIEGIYHTDYDDRHIIFSLIEGVSIGVIDVENSCIDKKSAISESEEIYSLFEKGTSSPRDKESIKSWYDLGYDHLVIPEKNPQISKIIEKLETKYDIKFDMKNKYINGVRIL